MSISSLLIVLLIVLDQLTKLIVSNYYGVRIPIIGNMVYFMPTLNKNYSWINSLFQLGLGRMFHVVSVVVILIFVYTALKYLENKVGNYSWVKTMKISFMSGGLCSLIDKVFWDGSLDYILLRGFFVFDLKDCYINIFTITAITIMFKYRKVINNLKTREVLKDLAEFIKNYSRYLWKLFMKRGEVWWKRIKKEG